MKSTLFTLIIVLGFAVQGSGQQSMTQLEREYAKNDTTLGKVNRGVDTTKTNVYVIEYDFKTGI